MLFFYFKNFTLKEVHFHLWLKRYTLLLKESSLLNQNLFKSCFLQLLKGKNSYLKMKMFHEVESH